MAAVVTDDTSVGVRFLMRISLTFRAVLFVSICFCAAMWLLWGFVPFSVLSRSLLTVLTLLVGMGWVLHRRRLSGESVSDEVYSGIDVHGPVALVCGDGAEEMFAGQLLRKTSTGCWLLTGEPGALSAQVSHLLSHSPALSGRLSVVYCCQPDGRDDEVALRLSLKNLRQQIKRIRDTHNILLPVVLQCMFAGHDTPWFIIQGREVSACADDGEVYAFSEWQQQDNHIASIPVLSQAMAFCRSFMLSELTRPDDYFPVVSPLAVVLRLNALQTADTSLWQRWLIRAAAVRYHVTSAPACEAMTFVDVLLPVLARASSPVGHSVAARYTLAFLTGCLLTALAFSTVNNAHLINGTHDLLTRWRTHPVSGRSQVLPAVTQRRLQLERWQRQGEPLRYGLGLYTGEPLLRALQQVTDTVAPVVPQATQDRSRTPTAPPQIVRLDSLSLFDPGSATLKPGSTKVLVNALVGIKARPGWLIVVSGHTDNTGSSSLNQMLSLKRAEAVRDWMRDTGGVPESCFAVQGYGATRPLQTNDTTAGRAANRRVEIRLVPQADACRIPGTNPMPSQDGGASQHQ
ncbi:OmpA family protein [Enterobacter cloacae complex sp. ESBL7]|uniref:OmpA family protein n=1 Tax=Enterobacter cloacae complex sp. ESBL7 TaxID=3163325 RepID=UPI00356160F8